MPISTRYSDALAVLAALLWLPQAAILAYCVGRLAAGGTFADVVVLAGVVFVLGAVRAGIDAVAARHAFRAARASLTALRRDAVAGLAARAPFDRARPASGAAASIIAEQAEAVVPWLSRFRPARLKALALPLVIFVTIFPISWVAALALLIALPVIPLFMALIGWKAKAASEAQLVEMGRMNAVLLERLRAMATIRGLGAVDTVAHHIRHEAESLRLRTMAVLRIAFLSSAVLELFAALGVAMVAVYVGFHLLGDLRFGAWGGRLSLAQGLFILLLAPTFFEPLREMSAVWHDRAAGQAAHDALTGLGAGELHLPDAAHAVAQPAPMTTPPSVRVEALSHYHIGAAGPCLAALDLLVKPGEHVALTGPSGCGKSTMLALIAGLMPVQTGQILIGGQVLDAQNLAALRATIGWIGQAPHIFPGSLAANVTLGRPGIDHDAVARALANVRLDHVAQARGTAPIGEGGMGISGGEALRLALARVAATPAGATLILADEPTAHLDPATAREVGKTLQRIAQGRTLIVATHDPRLTALMDRVIRLDHITNRKAAA